MNDPTNIFTAHEMLGMVNGNTATKFTVHINLFGKKNINIQAEVLLLSAQKDIDLFLTKLIPQILQDVFV